jgi:hypothetical protein
MRARHYAGMASVAMLMSCGISLAAQSVPAPPNLTPEARRQLELQMREALRTATLAIKPRVTCGMTVIPADPKIDPKAVKPAPDHPKGTIRQVPPSTCR